MEINKKEAKSAIKAFLADCYKQMPLLNELCEGSISHEDLREIALLHYAETKTFTNIKNPARLYLCPHEARHAKRYFCYLYEEEQGGFQEGMNHADLFKPVCYHLGISDEQMEECYRKYAKSWMFLFHDTPSMETMVRELGASVAWETLTPFFGDRLLSSLSDNYNLPANALRYFTVHYKVDQAHSARALDTLARYSSTEPLMRIAKASIKSVLIDDLHLLRPYGTIL